MDNQALRKSFVEWVLAQEGKPYCWPTPENHYSGKCLPGGDYQDCFDCSGLMTNGLFHASGTDWRADHNAQRLRDLCHRVEAGKYGDLAFYGTTSDTISHVMLVTGDGRVFGACGGGHLTTSPELAKQAGARVRFRPVATYRNDLKGFGSIPWELLK